MSNRALSSSCTSTQNDWETAFPAGDTNYPSNTHSNTHFVSLCLRHLTICTSQSREESLFIPSISYLLFLLPLLHLLLFFVRLDSRWSTWCFPSLVSKKLNDLPGLVLLCDLYSPIPFLWVLFLWLCPQDSSTDQVPSPSAFLKTHISRMRGRIWQSQSPGRWTHSYNGE